MQLGALLEEITVSKARAGIEKLANLTPRTARIITENGEKTVTADEVRPGNILRVLPGESIPADGILISGSTSIDQSVMTGESVPVDKTVGDEVSSGTINRFGAFDMKAEKTGEDSSIQRMIRLVKSADAGKAKIVGLADRWATWIVVIALTAAVLTWILSGKIIRAVTILVVFCPCALVLATPTAIMAAIGCAAKHGFLVSRGDALERLSKVNRIMFDKTGTLTYGRLKTSAVKSFDESISDNRLFELLAACEKLSEHPLAKAVVSSYTESYGEISRKCESFEMLPGLGISAISDGIKIAAGNEKLMKKLGIAISENEKTETEKYIKKGCTIIYVAANGIISGFAALSDTIRSDSRSAVRNLCELGIKPMLLTGDNERAAGAAAKVLGIEDVKAACLPEDKLKAISDCRAAGEFVCMVGDGINDAPALKAADTGIAMGGISSDIAVEAADIVLSNDKISSLPGLIDLSRRMMKKIRLNMIFSMTLNFLAIALAITGKLNPVIGALVHNAGSVAVIINSAFLLRTKRT